MELSFFIGKNFTEIWRLNLSKQFNFDSFYKSAFNQTSVLKTQLVWVVEYTDCISAQGWDSLNDCSG